MNEKLKFEMEMASMNYPPKDVVQVMATRMIDFRVGAEWMYERTKPLIEALEYIGTVDPDKSSSLGDYKSQRYFDIDSAKHALKKFYGEYNETK